MIPQPFPPFPPFPPQPFPPSPFPPFLPSPFPPHAGLICRVLASVWLHLVYKSFFPYISYTSTHCGVPTVPLIPFRTAEAPPVYLLCPLPRFVPRINLFLNRTLLTIFRRMTVICFCLHLMEIMSPLRTVSNQACDGSARWMNGSRSGVFGPDPTSEPCLNLSRHLARSRTL